MSTFVPLACTSLSCAFVFPSPENLYGTPKPPAEPSPAAPPLNVSEVLLPGARPNIQGKRNQSVRNMQQQASLEPPEEEEESSPPMVNGNGVAITPGERACRVGVCMGRGAGSSCVWPCAGSVSGITFCME